MEVIIEEMSSTVRAVDGQSLLHPSVVNRIISLAIARMKEDHKHECAVNDERKMKPALTSREISFWE